MEVRMSVRPSKSTRRRRVVAPYPSAVVTALSGVLLLSGCNEETPESSERPDENADAQAWRSDIRSSDAVTRARAADMIPGAPGDDGLEALERLVIHDEDARVREQAVIAYRQLAGADGERLLKDIALGDESEAVTSAALAALEEIAREHPRPARAWMSVDHPAAFSPGETVEVRVRFGSEESAPKALLQLRPPTGFAVPDRSELLWRGEVVAGDTQEITFRLVAPRQPVRSGARVRLQIDYPEELDFDLLQETLRVAIDDQGGRFEGRPTPQRRSARGGEVMP
jgi:hypothetical protein